MDDTAVRTDLHCPCGSGRSSCAFYLSGEKVKAPHIHCFKCNKQIFDKEIIEETLELNNVSTIMVQQETKPRELRPLQRGVCTALEDRGISKEVAEKFSVETLFTPDNQAFARAFNYKNSEGQIIAQKIKQFDGKIYWTGDPRLIEGFFGGHLVRPQGKYLTITEGEEDCLAAYQMLLRPGANFEPACVSISNGAGSAVRECKKYWEYVNSFEQTVISFDGDEVGKKASEEVSKLFEYKPKTIYFKEARKDTDDKWLMKDANDYLKAGRGEDYYKMWWRAEKTTPKGVLTMSSLWASMTEKDNDIVVPLPWPGLEKMLHGLRTGRLYIWKARPKIGKTACFKEIAYHIHKTSTYNSALILLEETKKTIGIGMCALELSKPIQFPDVPYTMEELEKAHLTLAKDDRFLIFDPEESRTVENIIAKIKYFVKAHDCKFIFLDHISMLAYQSGEGDERRFLDKLIADLKSLTTTLDICICAITHVNDEGQTRGSRAFAQLCDFQISLERDKLNPDPVIANTTSIIIEENRLTGESGLACQLFFDKKTGRMTEQDLTLKFEEESERDVPFAL